MAGKNYLVFRGFLSYLDLISDFLQSANLFHRREWPLAAWTLAFPVLALMLAFLSVCVRRAIVGNSMPFKKYILITLKEHSMIFEPVFEAGPELVLQIVVLILKSNFNWTTLPSVSSILSLVCLALSFFSLSVTTISRNGDGLSRDNPLFGRFFASCASTALASIYRAYIFAVLFSLLPEWSGIVLAILFAANVITLRFMDLAWDEAVIYGVNCLISPTGHGTPSSHTTGRRAKYSGVRTSVSEVERVRITQESLVRRVRISLALFHLFSILLLIPLVVVVETHGSRIPWLTENRLFLYLFPIVIFILNCLSSWIYYLRILNLRKAARIWDSITPSRGSLRPSSTLQPRFQELKPISALEAAKISAVGPEHTPDHHPYPLPRPNSPFKIPPGNSRCDLESSCVTCEFLIEGTTFRSMMTGKEYRFMTPVTCTSKNVVYLVTCNRCRKQYVGKTEQQLKQRHYGHRREIETESTPLGKHFSQGCGGYTSWRIQIIDQCSSMEDLRRREGYWQHELVTLLPWGLNSRDELGGTKEDESQAAGEAVTLRITQ